MHLRIATLSTDPNPEKRWATWRTVGQVDSEDALAAGLKLGDVLAMRVKWDPMDDASPTWILGIVMEVASKTASNAEVGSRGNRPHGTPGYPKVKCARVHSEIKELPICLDQRQLPVEPMEKASFKGELLDCLKGASRLTGNALPTILANPPRSLLMPMGLPYSSKWAEATADNSTTPAPEPWKATAGLLQHLLLTPFCR